jgi:hypothetical protein
MSALTIAIKAIDRDIKAREKALRDGLVDDDHHEECSQYVLDMMRSLAELISTYEKARRDQPNLPPVDGWLSAEYP